MRRTALSVFLCMASLCMVSAARTSRADDDALRIAVIQSGYPGSAKSAAGFLATLKEHLEKSAPARELELSYQNVPKDALAEISKAPPEFGVVSLGFYLENRHRFGMRSHLETTPQEKYFVIARRGTVESVDALRNKSVSGGALYEQLFLDWIVFPAAAVADWKAEPTLRPSRALRNLSRGKHEALVLNGREYRSLESIGKLQGMVKIAESRPFPVAVVVSFHGSCWKDAPAPELSREQRSLVDAFRGLSKDRSGQSILATMGCKEFRDVDAAKLKKLETTFDAHRKPKAESKAESESKSETKSETKKT